MNAVEIEEAISNLAEQSFDDAEFPYLFLQAFGNKETTIKRLRSGTSNKSDLAAFYKLITSTSRLPNMAKLPRPLPN
ncbi:MAG: type IIL restriction-modification enzyme MmeI [Methyloglobulus sp.]